MGLVESCETWDMILSIEIVKLKDLTLFMMKIDPKIQANVNLLLYQQKVF